MTEQCLIRVRPSSFQGILPSLDEYLTWEPCAEPVAFRVKETYAPNKCLMLCAKHRAAFESAPEIKLPWSTK